MCLYLKKAKGKRFASNFDNYLIQYACDSILTKGIDNGCKFNRIFLTRTWFFILAK